jgi:hypothetical protein
LRCDGASDIKGLGLLELGLLGLGLLELESLRLESLGLESLGLESLGLESLGLETMDGTRSKPKIKHRRLPTATCGVREMECVLPSLEKGLSTDSKTSDSVSSGFA